MKIPSRHRCLPRTEQPTNVPETESVEIGFAELVQQMETLKNLVGDNPSPEQRREMTRLYDMYRQQRNRIIVEMGLPMDVDE
jgi:hypothetical protein